MSHAGGNRRRDALVRAARSRSERRAAALELRRGLPPTPGDLFVLAATSDLPVEWAILEQRFDRSTGSEASAGSDGTGRLLAVPADQHPLAGSADLAVEPEGTPVLRCRFGLWLDPALFDPDLRSGVLSAETVASALALWRQVEAGLGSGSPLGEEADADPEYGDWIREVPERARALAARADPVSAPAWPKGIRTWFPALAATFAVVSLGLSLWVVELRRDLNQLEAPVLYLPSEEVVLGGGSRGESRLQVPPSKPRFVLVLVVDRSIGFREGYLEIASRAGRTIFRSPRLQLVPAGEIRLELSRRQFPDGLYRIRVYPISGFGVSPLTEETLRVETLDSGDR